MRGSPALIQHMRVIERAIDKFNSLSPRRQKAAECFAFSGLGAAMAGISVVPITEGGTGLAVGTIGLIEGAVGSVIMYRWGWQNLTQARQEEMNARQQP